MAELGPVPGSYLIYRPKVVERTVVPINRSTIDQILAWIDPAYVITNRNRVKDEITWRVAIDGQHHSELFLQEGLYIMYTPSNAIDGDSGFKVASPSFVKSYFEEVVTDA